MTLNDFVNYVIKEKLGFVKPSILIGSSNIYEEGEDDHINYIDKKIRDCPAGGIRNGTLVVIDDWSQDLKVTMLMNDAQQYIIQNHCQVKIVTKHTDLSELDEEKYPRGFSIEGYVAQDQVANTDTPNEAETNSDDDCDIIIFSPDAEVIEVTTVHTVDSSSVRDQDTRLEVPAMKRQKTNY